MGFAAMWAEREQTENELVRLCAEYDTLLRIAWRQHHAFEQGHLKLWLDWSLAVVLVSPAEDMIWRNAMVLRNAICERKFRIVLEDIMKHTDLLRPIVDQLPDRIAGLPGGDSNVVRLR